MSPLWVLPLCVLAVGCVALTLATVRLRAEVARVGPELDGLGRLADDAAGLRAELDAARARAAELADVPDRIRAARARARELRLRGTAQ